jgi:hypothetical protein
MSVAPKNIVANSAAPASGLRADERQTVQREALMRAVAIVQRYQDENWRRLRVNDICSEIKRLIKEEAGG